MMGIGYKRKNVLSTNISVYVNTSHGSENFRYHMWSHFCSFNFGHYVSLLSKNRNATICGSETLNNMYYFNSFIASQNTRKRPKE